MPANGELPPSQCHWTASSAQSQAFHCPSFHWELVGILQKVLDEVEGQIRQGVLVDVLRRIHQEVLVEVGRHVRQEVLVEVPHQVHQEVLVGVLRHVHQGSACWGTAGCGGVRP